MSAKSPGCGARSTAPFPSLGAYSVVSKFLRDECGATAIEYGLLAGLIALVVIGALSTVFAGIGNTLNFIGDSL
jgi:pilus assembly protein Flp/PilA